MAKIWNYGRQYENTAFFIFESQFPKNKKLTFGGLDNEKHLCILLKNITLIWYKYTYKTKNVD